MAPNPDGRKLCGLLPMEEKHWQITTLYWGSARIKILLVDWFCAISYGIGGNIHSSMDKIWRVNVSTLVYITQISIKVKQLETN